MYAIDNKKKLKKKYHKIIPENPEIGMININILQCALLYSKNLLNDIDEKCEGEEFFRRDYYVSRYDFTQKQKDNMLLYSNLTLPVKDLPESHQSLARLSGW